MSTRNEFEFFVWLKPATWRTASKIVTVFRYKEWWHRGMIEGRWRYLDTGKTVEKEEQELIENKRLAEEAANAYRSQTNTKTN